MSSESVSVVIPAYNAERFLREAVDSALGQSHPPAEVVVVDDGSSDRTADVARSVEGVRLISAGRTGVSTARNLGVAESSGAFIAFLDADDVWRPGKLARQLELLRARRAAELAVARQEYRFEGPVPPWFRGPRDGSSEPGYMPSSWLMPRRTWDRVGGFAEDMTHSEDTDWLARARDLGVEVAMVEESLVVHRIHDSNASGNAHAVRNGVLRALRESVRRKEST